MQALQTYPPNAGLGAFDLVPFVKVALSRSLVISVAVKFGCRDWLGQGVTRSEGNLQEQGEGIRELFKDKVVLNLSFPPEISLWFAELLLRLLTPVAVLLRLLC